MDRRIFIAFGAVAAALAVGARFLLGGRPDNLSLEALSGETLASDDGTLLVDIRTPGEWQESGVIDGALLVTYSDPASFLDAVRPHLHEGQRLALICRSGNRSSRAAAQIADRVDVPVVDVAGGMNRVLDEGYSPVAPTRAMGCAEC